MWVDLDACEEMREARAIADRMRSCVYPYAPHVSLAYGDLSEEQRRHIIRHPRLSGQLAAQADADQAPSKASAELGDIDIGSGLKGQVFRVRELWAIDCTGDDHSQWKPLHVFKLK